MRGGVQEKSIRSWETVRCRTCNRSGQAIIHHTSDLRVIVDTARRLELPADEHGSWELALPWKRWAPRRIDVRCSRCMAPTRAIQEALAVFCGADNEDTTEGEAPATPRLRAVTRDEIKEVLDQAEDEIDLPLMRLLRKALSGLDDLAYREAEREVRQRRGDVHT
jgi:hypothetical protein